MDILANCAESAKCKEFACMCFGHFILQQTKKKRYEHASFEGKSLNLRNAEAPDSQTKVSINTVCETAVTQVYLSKHAGIH